MNVAFANRLARSDSYKQTSLKVPRDFFACLPLLEALAAHRLFMNWLRAIFQETKSRLFDIFSISPLIMVVLAPSSGMERPLASENQATYAFEVDSDGSEYLSMHIIS